MEHPSELPEWARRGSRYKRFSRFLASPPEKVAERERQRLRPEHLLDLEAEAVERPDLWPLCRKVRAFHNADKLYRDGRTGLSVQDLRNILTLRLKGSVSSDAGEDSTEVIYLFWPVFVLVYRKKQPRAGGAEHSIAIVPLMQTLQTPAAAQGMLDKVLLAAPRLLQRFPGNMMVDEMAFAPPVRNVQYVISVQTRDGVELARQRHFPLAVAYQGLLGASGPQLDKFDRWDRRSRGQATAFNYGDDDFAERMAALLNAARTYDRTIAPLPAYLQHRVKVLHSEAYKRRSVVIDGKRRHRTAIETSGGSLDYPAMSGAGEEAPTMVERVVPGGPEGLPTVLPSPDSMAPAEIRVLIAQALSRNLPDPDDQHAVLLFLQGFDQTEIAAETGRSQSTISRRLSRALATLRDKING